MMGNGPLTARGSAPPTQPGALSDSINTLTHQLDALENIAEALQSKLGLSQPPNQGAASAGVSSMLTQATALVGRLAALIDVFSTVNGSL